MCRTVNGGDINFTPELYKENIESFIKNNGHIASNLYSQAQKDGRGNICPVTIILPTLAMEAKKDVEKDIVGIVGKNTQEAIIQHFMDILDTKIHEAKDMLIERFNWICSQNPKSASFMYTNNTMANAKYLLNLSHDEVINEMYNKMKAKILHDQNINTLSADDEKELFAYVKSALERDIT